MFSSPEAKTRDLTAEGARKEEAVDRTSLGRFREGSEMAETSWSTPWRYVLFVKLLARAVANPYPMVATASWSSGGAYRT
jgi:hypothetical protein